MSAHCNVLCFAFFFVLCFIGRGVDNCFSTLIFLLTEVKNMSERRKLSFYKKKKITCHRKTTSFMYKKTKGMILTFFWELRCCTQWINWILKMSDFKDFFLQIKSLLWLQASCSSFHFIYLFFQSTFNVCLYELTNHSSGLLSGHLLFHFPLFECLISVLCCLW